MKSYQSNHLMMRGWMMFGEVISLVERSIFPEDVKLLLVNSVVNPIKMHAGGFGVFLFDSVIGNASSGAVISLDGCGWLRMPKFFKCNADGAGFFACRWGRNRAVSLALVALNLMVPLVHRGGASEMVAEVVVFNSMQGSFGFG
jgi:hypothetical protein